MNALYQLCTARRACVHASTGERERWREEEAQCFSSGLTGGAGARSLVMMNEREMGCCCWASAGPWATRGRWGGGSAGRERVKRGEGGPTGWFRPNGGGGGGVLDLICVAK